MTYVNMPERMNELTDETVRSVDAATEADIDPCRTFRAILPRWALAVALAALAAAAPADAQQLDPASQDALDKTLQILLDPNARGAEIARSPQGSAVDQQVRALTGSDALTKEFYAVAGQVLVELAQANGGDPQKMLQAVERAKTDPTGFAAMLSPATQQRLRDLAVSISDKKR